MKIRKSRPEDLERMLRLYADARVFMAEHGNPTQWANGYPEPEMLQEDIQASHIYQTVLCQKYHIPFTNEYQRQLPVT